MGQNHEQGTFQDLAKYRLDSAKSELQSARILYDAGQLKGANNRAYYAIYHAISAVHALDGNAYKRHKDALANFNKEYVKTEVFSRNLGRKIAAAEEIRHASDYDDFYIASKEESERQIIVAAEFIQLIEIYCMAQIRKEE